MTHRCDGCGLCCKHLIIEIDHLDVVREPRLAPPATRLLDGGGSVRYESEWEKQYGLACGPAHPCPMLGPDNRCGIYPTRPNCCVAFEAGGDQCQELRAAHGLPPLRPEGEGD